MKNKRTRRTHKQRTKLLEEQVLGDSIITPTEYEPDTAPVQIHHNGCNLTIAT